MYVAVLLVRRHLMTDEAGQCMYVEKRYVSSLWHVAGWSG
jgi:hypothetical protein